MRRELAKRKTVKHRLLYVYVGVRLANNIGGVYGN